MDTAKHIIVCYLLDVRCLQAHKLADRVHDIDLEALDGKTVSEVGNVK